MLATRTPLTGLDLLAALKLMSREALEQPVTVWTYDQHGLEIENEIGQIEDGDGVSIVCY